MLPQHSVPESNEVVIWTAGSLLAALLGLGGAFGLWLFLRHSDAQTAAHAAVVTLGAGIAVVGLSAERPPARLFWIVLAGMMLVGYLFGGPEFSRLVP
jgi:drug/metabolite transporter superfamily protein YnfA